MRYVPNHRGLARYLRSPEVRETLGPPTRATERRALALAPVDRGDYRDSIDAYYRHGWKDGRVVGVVEATAAHSAAVEWGNRANGETAQHVLRRAASGED